MTEPNRRFVLIILDGAADQLRIDGRSPLAIAHTPYLDAIARDGCTGVMTTLYPELPRESLVALLGMLGWDPAIYYPGGRASSELAVLDSVRLRAGDVVFRANLVRLAGGTLESYSAHLIDDGLAARLVRGLDAALRPEFPGFELHHVNDYRTLLLVRGAYVAPRHVHCDEPHDHEGTAIDIGHAVHAVDPDAREFAARVNDYIVRAAELLAPEAANALLPWGLSTALHLPRFSQVSGIEGPSAIVGAMAFLSGIASAGSIEFVQVGNGRPDSDVGAKGRAVVELLRAGYQFVCCHVNAPDEASHLHDPALKIRCLERIDAELIKPVFTAIQQAPSQPHRLLVLPDHYSNSEPGISTGTRREIHTIDPVPFALWGDGRDAVAKFDEDAVRRGRYGGGEMTHLDILDIMGAGPSRVGGAVAPTASSEIPARLG